MNQTKVIIDAIKKCSMKELSNENTVVVSLSELEKELTRLVIKKHIARKGKEYNLNAICPFCGMKPLKIQLDKL